MKKNMRETVSKEALASAPAAHDDETSELMARQMARQVSAIPNDRALDQLSTAT